eukprot:COSAG06_NODE_27546_length_591_cov_0.876016_1_plen_71_part_10
MSAALAPRAAAPASPNGEVTDLQENAAFFSTFPMLVPSVSWHNDHFYYKKAQKAAFSYRLPSINDSSCSET